MNKKNLKMTYGKREKQEQLVTVLVKDQGLKFVMKVQLNNQGKRRREKNNDQEAVKNEENHQTQ